MGVFRAVPAAGSERLLVFLIDDDVDDQEIFSITVGKISPQFRCEFADDGVDALEMLQRGKLDPDIILIDLNMPRMGGIECLGRIKKMDDYKQTSAYIYSTSDDQVVVERCMKLGAAGFIKKEADPHVLQKKLASIFLSTKPEAFQ